MTDYLQAALKHIGKEGSEVLAHSVSLDGQAYVVILSPGPKYRIPLSELEGTEETAEKHPLYGLTYRELQAVAKSFGIPANQSADDLIAELLKVSDEEEE